MSNDSNVSAVVAVAATVHVTMAVKAWEGAAVQELGKLVVGTTFSVVVDTEY